MKHLVIIAMLHLHLTGLTQQGLGSFHISAFSNNDNKIKNNVKLKTIQLLIISLKTRDTIVNSSCELPLKTRYLSQGKYQLIAKTANYREIEAYCTVNSDRITFVEFLFEPQKKKRKHFVTGEK